MLWNKRINFTKKEIALFLLFALLLFKVDFSTDLDAEFYYKKEDIYYEFQAAKQLQNNENPYDRIVGSDMLENDKYATQLPLYFYFLSLVRSVAQDDFSGFIEMYRGILFCFQLAGGVFIYLIFRRANNRLLGLCAAFFYCFNVWTLNSFLYLKQDMIALALLIASFYFFRNVRYRWVSYLLYGVSLGIKHIGIFVLPLYITPLVFKEDTPKKFWLNMTVLLGTVLVPTLPLFVDNPNTFVKSMLFSVTRAPLSTDILFGYSELLIKYNSAFDSGTLVEQLLPRVPLVVSSVLAAALLFLKKIPASTYLFVSIMVFAVFNPVIFAQYITWLPPLALLAVVDYLES